jgi:AraC-like DNA-binding protein
MKMAADMLRTKQYYTITEVAYKVGFIEPGYFSKTFKFIFNLRPSEYVKSQEKTAKTLLA